MTEALQQTIEGGEIDHWEVVGSRPPVAEGDTCDKCGRRVPHAKKKASPKTKVSSYRTPLDDAESHDEVAQAAAEALDIYKNPHWRWAVNTYGYALILQGARLEETGS